MVAPTQATSDHHVGHFFMEHMSKYPDEIFHIDAATELQESRRSALSRTVRLARSLRRFGLRPGDVLVLGGRNHLDVHIPFYAALLNGLPMAGVDPQSKYKEIIQLFKIVEPKIAFCEPELYEDYQRAVVDLGLATKIVTFGVGETSMASFMDIYEDSEPQEQFEVAQFDVSKVYCWLVSTSGSTGFPKVAALSHSIVLHTMNVFGAKDSNIIAQERRCALNVSSLEWISPCFNVLGLSAVHYIKLQSSAPCTTEHVIDIINKYKPVTMATTPRRLAPILHHKKHCDLTCFEVLRIGGSTVHHEFLNRLRARIHKDAVIKISYGMTETSLLLMPSPDGPIGNIGRPLPFYEIKLVDADTGRTILEPHVSGELWVKGPIMECYYNNPKATAEAFSEEGFFKTGDLLYRDENNYYFFVERLKMLLKYKNYMIIPPEVEEVILSLRGVEQACVVGVPHPDDGERAAAAVQRRARAALTAQQVKEHVANHLPVPKQLHGGVVFLDEFPLTSTGKINRVEVKKLVLQALRE